MKRIKCCICSTKIDERDSRNSNPVKRNGRCCVRCDDTVVAPVRLIERAEDKPFSVSMPDINSIMSKVRPQVKKISGNDKDMCNDFVFVLETTYGDMIKQYINGKLHKALNQPGENEEDFINSFKEKGGIGYGEIMYDSFCNGYDGKKFDDTINLTARNGIDVAFGGKSNISEQRINRAMRRAKPRLKKVANGNKEMFINFSGFASEILSCKSVYRSNRMTHHRELTVS